MMMMKGCLTESTDTSVLCEEEVSGSLQKRWGREKTEERGKGKCWEETRERTKRQKSESRERNTTACRAKTRRDVATPLIKTRRPGEYLKTRLAFAIEPSEVDKPVWRVQQFVGLKGWWRCGHWKSRGAEQSWPQPTEAIGTVRVFSAELRYDLRCWSRIWIAH